MAAPAQLDRRHCWTSTSRVPGDAGPATSRDPAWATPPATGRAGPEALALTATPGASLALQSPRRAASCCSGPTTLCCLACFQRGGSRSDSHAVFCRLKRGPRLGRRVSPTKAPLPSAANRPARPECSSACYNPVGFLNPNIQSGDVLLSETSFHGTAVHACAQFLGRARSVRSA